MAKKEKGKEEENQKENEKEKENEKNKLKRTVCEANGPPKQARLPGSSRRRRSRSQAQEKSRVIKRDKNQEPDQTDAARQGD